MRTRIITAIVLIAAVLAWLFLADYPVFTMGALFIYMVGAYEMGPLLGYSGKIPFVVIAAAAATACFALANPGLYIETGVPDTAKYLVAVSVIVWIAALPLLKSYPANTAWHKNRVVTTVLGLLLLLPFLEGLLILRADEWNSNRDTGAYLVLAVMALVWAADSGAYFTGRAMGKTKMLPAVSPNKTREGLYGGMALALLAMAAFMEFGLYSNYAADKLALTAACLVAIFFSVIGDLMESMLKRIAGIKDSGKIFPGHGGMLDRIDSQLAAVPLFLTVYWLISGELF